MRGPCKAVLLIYAASLFAQSNIGELRLKVTDQSDLPVPSSVELVSQANQVRQKLETDPHGMLVAKRLPFGMYRIQVEHPGFSPFSALIEIRSAIPKEYRVTLGVAPVETVVVVDDAETLLDPHRTAAINRIGSDMLQTRLTAGSEWSSASPWIGIPDPISCRRRSPHRKPFAGVFSGTGS